MTDWVKSSVQVARINGYTFFLLKGMGTQYPPSEKCFVFDSKPHPIFSSNIGKIPNGHGRNTNCDHDRFAGSKLSTAEDHHVKRLIQIKAVEAHSPPAGVVQKFREGVPAQVSSSSLDRGSKLQGPSSLVLVFLQSVT
ncbi:hypothetical protein TNCV_834821 [Trichonephila clavipes]|nr:hypothetical protein TNCV_834821 [Trichonephila clavipes]